MWLDDLPKVLARGNRQSAKPQRIHTGGIIMKPDLFLIAWIKILTSEMFGYALHEFHVVLS